MKNLKLILLAIAVPLILNSCIPYIRSETSGYISPGFEGKGYSRFCVIANFNDYTLKDAVEYKVTEELHSYGLKAAQGGMLFPPVREWADSEVLGKARGMGLQALIIIDYRAFDKTLDYIPPTTTTTEKKTKRKKKGGSDEKGEKETIVVTETETTPGYYRQIEITSFNIEIIDIETETTVWVGTTQGKGGPWHITNHNRSYVLSSFARNLAGYLWEWGVLAPQAE